MPIVLRVDSEFDQRAAAEAAREAERYWERKAAQLKVNAQLDQASARKAEGEAKEFFLRRAAEYKVEAKLDERSARLAATEAKRIFSDIGKSAGSIAPSVDIATGSFSQLGTAMGALGKVGTPVLLVGLASAMVEVAGVAASAAQSIALIPAAAGAAAAGIGTLKIATLGFSDAMDSMGDPAKFAQALQNLAPSAQQAATSIKALVDGPLKGLQQATQQSLFAGVGEQLTALTTQYLPSIQAMTTGIADSFNQMFQGVTDQLMTPETQGAMQQFMNNTVAAFQQLAPAVAPLTKAFADIMAVGSDFLPDLASAATDAANAFSKFISEARQSGELKKFMGEGLDTLKQLGQVAWEVGKAFMALAPTGREVLPDIIRLLKSINEIMPVIGAAALLLGPSFGAWTAALAPISGMIKGISTAWDSVAAHVIPVVNSITTAVNKLTEPIRYLMSLVGVDVPAIAAIAQPSSAVTGQGSTVSENRTSRRPAGLPGSFTAPTHQAPSGQWWPDTRAGWNPSATPSSSTSSAAPSFTAPASASTSGYGDAALLANVPAGRYSQTQAADLTKGIGDCSSAVEDLVNLLDGRPTGGRSMATGNAEQWLTSHGFLPGAGGPGDFRVGFNSGHMQATLPGGTPFNWGSDAAAARGGVGGTGADDPAFTSHFYRPGTGGSGGGAGTPAALGGFGGAGAAGAIPVWVTNFDQMMTSGGPAAVPGAGAGGPAGPGAGAPDAAGGFDPLGAFFSGLQQGGGIPGIVGSFGNNILGQVRSQTFDSGGHLQPGITIAQNNTGKPERVVAPSAPNAPGAAIGSSFGASPTGGIGQNTSPGSLADKGATSVGGVDKPSTPGGGQSGGGLAGAATSAAATAADMFAPGSGAAVQIASQEIQRAIKFAGQVTAIGVNGLMETFLPMGASDLAQNNWLTRIAGGFSGVQPQIANTAGKSASVDEMNKKGAGQAAPVALPPPLSSGQGSEPGPQVVNVNVDNSRVHDIQSDVTHHQTQTDTMTGQR